MPLMKMTGLPEFGRILLRGVAALALALTVAACGPGTGGTGTGPVNGSIGFSSGPASPGVPSSICTNDCSPVTLQLGETDVELRAGCLRFSHTGVWFISADGRATLEGELTVVGGAGPTLTNGILRIDFAGAPNDSQQVTVTLTDIGGGVLLGAQVLIRQAAADFKPSGCP